MSFSAALKLSDLNDYIAPAQACTKPTTKQPSLNNATEYAVMKEDTKDTTTKATINLSDCLACSGCITSAESVLITMQSHEQVYKAYTNSRYKSIIVSISPQTYTAFATKYSLTREQVMQKLTWFFKVHLNEATFMEIKVYDTCFARDFSLMESAREFIRKYTNKNSPVITSACPGWICYAEKTHGDTMLEYISSVRSPQQVMGALVKDHFAKLHQLETSDIFHLSIMPCFDKKLEASRPDFELMKEPECREVDCVISTGELEVMIMEQQLDIQDMPTLELDTEYSNLDQNNRLLGTLGSGSGGYLEYVLNYAAQTLYPQHDHQIIIKQGRNPDMTEYILTVNDDEQKLKFASAYGFRNIQNIVRKIKSARLQRKKPEWDYIEVMACPSGCLNGGGQLKPTSADGGDLVMSSKMKEFISDMDNVYRNVPLRRADENDKVLTMYQEWLGGIDSDKARQMLHTQYHDVKSQSSAGSTW